MSKDKQKPSTFQRIGVDILGILLIISSALFGWIPGPGGLPLLFAGLGLLATNHEWARKLLDTLKNKGVDIIDAVLNYRPWVPVVLDGLAVIFVFLAMMILVKTTGNLIQSFAIALTFTGIGLFLVNRKRINAINSYVRSIRQRYRDKPKK